MTTETGTEPTVAPWPLIGRHHELKIVEDVVNRGGSLVLVGPSGVGKSGLLRTAREQLRERGRATMSIAGSQAVQGVTLAPLLALVPPQVDERANPAQLYRAMLTEVRAMQDVVVLVDDAHQLDDASAALVAAIITSTDAPVLLAARSDERLPDALDSLWRDGTTLRADLAFLTEEHIIELLDAVLEGPVDPHVSREIWRLSKGSPLFVHELVVANRENGSLYSDGSQWRLSDTLVVSDGLRGLIERRLLDLPNQQREALRILAVREVLSRPLVESIVGGEGALSELLQRSLVAEDRSGRRTELRLGHPMYGEVIRQSPGPDPRSVSRLADAIEEYGARRRLDPLTISTLRLVTGEDVTPDLMLRASTQAFVLTDYRLAEELAQHPSIADTTRGASLLGRALLARHRTAEADEVFDKALAIASTAEAAALHTTLARAALEIRMDLEACHSHLTAARGLAASEAERSAITSVAGLVSFITGWPRSALADFETIDLSELDPLSRSGVSMVQSTARLIAGDVSGSAKQCAETRRLISAHGAEWLDESRSDFTEFMAIGMAEPERGLALMYDQLDTLASQGADASLLMEVGIMHLCMQSGRFAEGLESASRWARLRQTGSDTMTEGSGRNAAAILQALSGRWADAMTSYRLVSELPMALNTDPLQFLTHGLVLGGRGDREACRGELMAGVQMATEQHLLLFGAELAHHLSLFGAEEEARTVLSDIVADVGTDGRAGWAVDHWLRGVELSLAEDADGLDALAASELALGFVPDAVRDLTRAARHSTSPLGRLRRLIEARTLALRTGGVYPTLDEVDMPVSAREVEIVLAAAAGKSNRDIAYEQTVSQRTVENHLHRACRKLEATRADLVDSLGGLDLARPST